MSASKIVLFFLILALFFTSIGGIVVASVLKEMDNVVKVRKKIVCLCKTPGSCNFGNRQTFHMCHNQYLSALSQLSVNSLSALSQLSLNSLSSILALSSLSPLSQLSLSSYSALSQLFLSSLLFLYPALSLSSLSALSQLLAVVVVKTKISV